MFVDICIYISAVLVSAVKHTGCVGDCCGLLLMDARVLKLSLREGGGEWVDDEGRCAEYQETVETLNVKVHTVEFNWI